MVTKEDFLEFLKRFKCKFEVTIGRSRSRSIYCLRCGAFMIHGVCPKCEFEAGIAKNVEEISNGAS